MGSTEENGRSESSDLPVRVDVSGLVFKLVLVGIALGIGYLSVKPHCDEVIRTYAGSCRRYM